MAAIFKINKRRLQKEAKEYFDSGNKTELDRPNCENLGVICEVNFNKAIKESDFFRGRWTRSAVKWGDA